MMIPEQRGQLEWEMLRIMIPEQRDMIKPSIRNHSVWETLYYKKWCRLMPNMESFLECKNQQRKKWLLSRLCKPVREIFRFKMKKTISSNIIKTQWNFVADSTSGITSQPVNRNDFVYPVTDSFWWRSHSVQIIHKHASDKQSWNSTTSPPPPPLSSSYGITYVPVSVGLDQAHGRFRLTWKVLPWYYIMNLEIVFRTSGTDLEA